MPRKSAKSKPKLEKPELIEKSLNNLDAGELDDFVLEANEVAALNGTKGLQIIKRDLSIYRDGISKRLAYLDPSRPEFNEARILFMAIDKIFAIFEDYKINREKAVDVLNRLNNPDIALLMDVDNE